MVTQRYVDHVISYALHFFLKRPPAQEKLFARGLCYSSVRQLGAQYYGAAPVAQGKRPAP